MLIVLGCCQRRLFCWEFCGFRQGKTFHQARDAQEQWHASKGGENIDAQKVFLY